MGVSEKVAYLKGLAEGLGLDAESKEGKLFAAIIDVLDEMAEEILDLEEEMADIEEGLDAVSDDLSEVEETLYELEDEFDDDDDEDEEYDDEGFDFGDEDSTIYEVECACGNIINFDEETLEEGSIVCDECGELLEFSLEDEE